MESKNITKEHPRRICFRVSGRGGAERHIACESVYLHTIYVTIGCINEVIVSFVAAGASQL